MTSREIIELQNKSIRNMPIPLWNEFAGECKKHGMNVSHGAIEAFRDWLDKKRRETP